MSLSHHYNHKHDQRMCPRVSILKTLFLSAQLLATGERKGTDDYDNDDDDDDDDDDG